MTKTYTLELDADELEPLRELRHCSVSLADKLAVACEKATNDREADELRLPWRVELVGGNGWGVVYAPNGSGERMPISLTLPLPIANRIAAARELLEAVEAWNDADWTDGVAEIERARRLTRRALRKVKSGVPE